MFKNGYAFVARTIPAASGTAEIIEVPRASLGTLWFLTDDGSAIELVESVTDIERTSPESPIGSIPDLVRANIGKRVSMLVLYTPTTTERLVGRILSVAGTLVMIQTDPGERQSVNLASIADLRSGELVTTAPSPQERERRFYRIKKSKPGGNVVMLSLERGMTWAPAYALDLTDPKKLTFVARATLLNDVLDLKSVPTRLITGFPNLPFASILDPISSGLSVDQWLGTLGMPGSMVNESRGGRQALMAQKAYAPMADALTVDFSGVPEAAGEGEGIGDLYFYDLKNVTLPRGARQSLNLFRFESEYRHVYVWDLAAEFDINQMRPIPIPREEDAVWHTIEFKNTTSQPLTTGVATILQKGELTGQTMLSYVPAGAKAEARINKALDVTTDRLEEEITRERGAIKDQNGNPYLDRITIKGTLKATNRKAETITLRVKKEVVGEILSASDAATILKLPGGLGQQNGRGRATWTVEIKAGEEKTLTYSYRVYVRA